MILSTKSKIISFIVLTVLMVSCSQTIDRYSTSTTTTPTPTTPTPSASSSPATPDSAYIKFFNTVNYGDITAILNYNVDSGLVKEYGATSYYKVKAGVTNIIIKNKGYYTLGLSTELTAGGYYSCFFYKVGYDWKMSIIKDDLTLPIAGSSKIRILDFRTQASNDYVKIKVWAVGGDDYTDSLRHFIDHTTYSFFANFKTVLASSNYNALVYNDTANLSRSKVFALQDRKIYSLLLTTDATLSSADAIKKSILP